MPEEPMLYFECTLYRENESIRVGVCMGDE